MVTVKSALALRSVLGSRCRLVKLLHDVKPLSFSQAAALCHRSAVAINNHMMASINP